ncbi:MULTISPECIES: efflux RND transporter periplasmic adaptor subunit [Sphingomonadales]|jgi:membrane fusion protein, heavy metal efflux system|uniref:Metal transporter n=1 Tax=Sphingobium cupriresistens LL01 TaxID=1420583 RepID=A0A0J7XKZ5_9SPHN|nr:efflux RND transporter periplasmic adaptor subunit [Sphingobium cupriresistens]KMS52347.1 metal transporter [Sphingobium cupriresistens LL01]|tara:strand:- start:4209 stop:5363 length:1155 start_codon:yes stop_codon:yes gene_type:complete
MNPERNKLYAGAAMGLLLAALAGFGVARMTGPSAPTAETEAAADAAQTDTVVITQDGIKTSRIGVAPAAAGGVAGIILASATVEATPDAEAVLTARAAGTVTRIFKRIGDPVSAGETIALVESRDASAIAADRSTAAARVTLASRQLARERILLNQGVSPRADYETAEANLAVAQAEARQASAAASAAMVSRDGRSVAVVSSISGRITSAPVNLGAFVQAETELFRVADPRRLQIEASMPAADALRVKAGDRVELTTNNGQKVEGQVRSATGVVDPQTRQATVVVTPSGGGGLIAPGQLVQARIFASGGDAASGVNVPQDAVQTLGDRSVVFVRTRQGFKAQTVRVGTRSGGMVEIASGLPANTVIATTNAFLLKAELGKGSAE